VTDRSPVDHGGGRCPRDDDGERATGLYDQTPEGDLHRRAPDWLAEQSPREEVCRPVRRPRTSYSYSGIPGASAILNERERPGGENL